MRTRIVFGMMALALAAMLAGCGKPDTPNTAGGESSDGAPSTAAAGESAKAITIWWAEWAPAVGLQELGVEFEKQTGIKVTVEQIPWSSYHDKVMAEFAKKETAFDVVVGDSQWIGRGATRGFYLDLSDWLPTAIDMNTVHPNAKTYLCEYPAGSGRYYAAPCETDAVGFAYRRDWFEDEAEMAAFKQKYDRDLAVPETWKEFREVAEFFTRPEDKRWGCAILTGRGYDSLVMGYQNFLWAFGGSWGDPATYTASGHINNAGSVEALTFMKSLLDYAPPGAENFDYGKTLESFQNNSVAMTMDYFAFFPSIQESKGDAAGFFAIPSHNGTRVVSLGGQGFSVSQKTSAAKQDAAKQFIAWFLTTDVQKQWITKPAGFTANTAILNSEEFRSATPYNAPFAESVDAMRDFWNTPNYNQLLAAAREQLALALDGEKTPQEALDQLAERHDALMKKEGLQQ